MGRAAKPLVESFNDEPDFGWTTMTPDDLLAFHAATKGMKDRGLEAYDNGTREGSRGQEVRVYGVTRSGANMQVTLVAAKLVGNGPDFDANIAKLERRAVKARMPFDGAGNDGVALVGVEAEDFVPGDRNAPRKVINLVTRAEDAMASFISGAREAGLLKGVTIHVREAQEQNLN